VARAMDDAAVSLTQANRMPLLRLNHGLCQQRSALQQVLRLFLAFAFNILY